MPPAAAWSGGVMKVGSGANRRNPLIFFETQRPLFAADFSQHELISNRTLFSSWAVVMMMDRRVSKAARDPVSAHLLVLEGLYLKGYFPARDVASAFFLFYLHVFLNRLRGSSIEFWSRQASKNWQLPLFLSRHCYCRGMSPDHVS